MPLKRSANNKARNSNIRAEIQAGKPTKQAVAIGYSVQRDADRPSSTAREKIMAKEKKGKRGRIENLRPMPSTYRPEFAVQAEKLCKLGATDVELMDFFGIANGTFYNWRNQFPDFTEAIHRGKSVADAEVASKLFHRATGYEHPDTHVSMHEGRVILTPLVKHYPPDTTAAIFWLKNRRSDLWKDRMERDIRVKVDAQDLTDEELLRIAAGRGNGTAEAPQRTQIAPGLH